MGLNKFINLIINKFGIHTSFYKLFREIEGLRSKFCTFTYPVNLLRCFNNYLSHKL